LSGLAACRSACPRLLAQLEVLRHHLALEALVVGDDTAQEEVRPVEPRVRPARIGQALAHLGEEADEPDRVDVEDGGGEAPMTDGRIVAGQREHVVEASRTQLPPATLERVPVPVLAGEVDDHLLPARDQVGSEGVGREHRVPGGVSVIERTSILGSAARSRASASTLAPPSEVIGPRLVTSSAATTKPPGRARASRSELTPVNPRRPRQACRTCGSSRWSSRPSTGRGRVRRPST
jgi:hypothetical protein